MIKSNNKQSISSSTHSRIRITFRVTACAFLILSSMLDGRIAFGQAKLAASQGRCATRISVALFGTSPTADLAASQDPQAMSDELLAKPELIDRFAAYFNSRANPSAGATTGEDASYHMAKYIMTNKEPWKNMFIGQYDVTIAGAAAAQTVSITKNPLGLGYFRSKVWMDRFAGNEPTGIKLSTAYRIMNNIVGLELTASTNAPGADVSATGRQAAACRGCHYDGWYALDKAAALLSTAKRTGMTIAYTPPDGLPKPVLGGLMLKDDGELVNALVNSDQFSFNACRLAFGFLYGRNENACESELFDKCIESFKGSGQIQSALSTIIKDPSFCQ